MSKELIGSGAEAVIYKSEGNVIKDRVVKSYRIEEIDQKLRKTRTKREAKVLERLKETGVPVPAVLKTDTKEMQIIMDHLDGPKVRDVLEKEDSLELSFEIGRLVGVMHTEGIIHGDLTTSNMIYLDSEKKGYTDQVYFIDFGLSFFSQKIEDMAVDLHLLRQALESKHFTIWEDCMKKMLEGYSESQKDSENIIKRYEQVELRGRNKAKF